LLDYFGYRRNNQNEYVYQSSTSAHETEKRGKGVDEFVKFYDYLKNVKSDSLNELERFIQVKLFIKKHEHFYFCVFFFLFRMSIDHLVQIVIESVSISSRKLLNQK